MIGSLHDLTCVGPDDCTCKATYIANRCDEIVNNGMGEPTECGRTLPCEYHSPIAKPTPRVRERKRLSSKPHVIPASVRQAVLERDHYECGWCEVPGGALDCHHVTPRSQGGRDQPDTLVAVHRICHSYIHEHPSEAKARGFLS